LAEEFPLIPEKGQSRGDGQLPASRRKGDREFLLGEEDQLMGRIMACEIGDEVGQGAADAGDDAVLYLPGINA